jgi:hypothetical protein
MTRSTTRRHPRRPLSDGLRGAACVALTISTMWGGFFVLYHICEAL